jgi:hypothetical protein
MPGWYQAAIKRTRPLAPWKRGTGTEAVTYITITKVGTYKKRNSLHDDRNNFSALLGPPRPTSPRVVSYIISYCFLYQETPAQKAETEVVEARFTDAGKAV